MSLVLLSRLLDSNIEGMRNCLNYSLVMLKAQKIICEKLLSKKLPRLDYRVSVDYGAIIIMNTMDSASIDMIGPPVNMSVKINHCTPKNEFVIGGDMMEIVKKCREFNFKQTQGFNI